MVKSNSWTEEQDALLVDIVLGYVSKRKTQLEAFEDAGRRLGRTPDACGYRWNGVLRKRHKSEFMSARERGAALMKENPLMVSDDQSLDPEIENAFNVLKKHILDQQVEKRQLCEEIGRIKANYAILHEQYTQFQLEGVHLVELIEARFGIKLNGSVENSGTVAG